MRILKYVLIVIVAIVAIFFLLGLFIPSIQYQCDVNVDATANEAWESMQDEANLSKWLNGYQRSELISGQADTVGAVSEIYFLENGEEMIIKETITQIEPNERMAMTFTMDFMDMDYEMLMDEDGGQTTITTNSTVKGNGMLSRSLAVLMKGSMVSQEEENLDKLKKVIEGDL